MRSSIVSDFTRLRQAFNEKNDARFSAFAEAWRSMDFSMVHYAEKEADMRRLLLQECYECVISVLAPAPHVDVFLWVVFTLYALFKTQICVPTVYIDVDIKTWNKLLVLHALARQAGHRECEYIFGALVKEHAFVHVVRGVYREYPIVFGKKDAPVPQPLPEDVWDEIHSKRLMQGQAEGIPVLNAIKTLTTAYEAEKAALGLRDLVSMVSASAADEIYARKKDYWAKRDKRLEIIANLKPRAHEGPPMPRRRRTKQKQKLNRQIASDPFSPSNSESALPWRRRGRISAAELLASNASTPALSEVGLDSEQATPQPEPMLYLEAAHSFEPHQLPPLNLSAALSMDMPEVGVAPKRTTSRPGTAPASAPASRPVTPISGRPASRAADVDQRDLFGSSSSEED